MHNYIQFLIILLLVNFIQCSKHCSQDISDKCKRAADCDACLKIDPCCVFCFQTLPNNITSSKCDLMENLLNFCDASYIEINNQSSSTPKEKNPFQDYESYSESSTQFKPQKIDVTLKEGIPVNVTIEFKLAKDYPLDLYYLLDISYDMESHINSLIKLAEDLPRTLTKLTKNYRIAFGTFMDKIAFPFAHTDKDIFHEMCLRGVESSGALNCDETGYLYRHHLDFNNNTSNFIEELKKVKLSGNNDMPEAALEAVHQVIHCKNIIHWKSDSRKIILIPTNGSLKLAGDGILAGAVRYPVSMRDKCHLDSSGNYVNPLVYDYPSLEEIDYLLDKEKTKIIFGIQESSDLYSYYSQLQKTALENVILISNMTKKNNIRQVIREGFYNFAHRVNIFINSSQYDGLDIQYYAKCGKNSPVKKGSDCELDATNPYDILTFNISFTLKKKPVESDGTVLFVEEEGIREKVELNFRYLSALCKCNSDVKVLSSGHGERRCNKTICHEGWGGEDCSKNCELETSNDCRIDEYARMCNGNGYCECGQCECFHSYAGKYCENQCPINRKTRRICSGNGVCTSDGCQCFENFNGTDCSCDLSTNNCMDNGKMCNGRGQCECNRCNCKSNFAGRACERISKRFCTLYRNIAEDPNLWQNKTHYQNIHIRGLQREDNKPQKVHECMDNICEIVDNDECPVKFCGVLENDNINLFIVDRNCSYSAQTQFGIGLLIFVFAAVILIGLFIIAYRKWKLRRDEKREFESFVLERENPFSLSANENPYYKNPVTTITNPQYKKKN